MDPETQKHQADNKTTGGRQGRMCVCVGNTSTKGLVCMLVSITNGLRKQWWEGLYCGRELGEVNRGKRRYVTLSKIKIFLKIKIKIIAFLISQSTIRIAEIILDHVFLPEIVKMSLCWCWFINFYHMCLFRDTQSHEVPFLGRALFFCFVYCHVVRWVYMPSCTYLYIISPYHHICTHILIYYHQ